MTAPAPSSPLELEEIKLGSFEFWLSSDAQRDAAFKRLRDERPISFHAEEPIVEGGEAGPGFWALTRHVDVFNASRHPDIFSSGRGVNIGDLPIEISEFFGSMIAMDDPRHARLRMIVQKAFTPKMVAQIELDVQRRARELIERVRSKGSCDFVADIAAPLPLEIICDMMGIPHEDHKRMFELTNVILGAGDPEFGQTIDVLINAGLEMFNYAQALGDDRRANPREDLTTKLVTGNVDGESLTNQELGSFFILLVVAGNETTRNAISHGMKALTDHPEQRQIWMNDFDKVAPTAVEEIVRWATPVIHFRRTATRDTELSGQKIAEGDKIVMWYNSANRDERAYLDPYKFDVLREINPHQVGFGAGGPHFCLGANLARREVTMVFREIFEQIPDLQITGAADRLLSPFINGIKRLPCEFTPR
jgi:cytochrome P450